MQMKKLAMIALTAAAPAMAGSWLDCCCPDLCYNVGVGAEALYWSPCTYQFEYATLDSTRTVGGVDESDHKPFVHRPQGEWGFRIFGTVADECNCNFANLEWVYVKGTTTTTLNTGDSNVRIQPADQLVALGSNIFARQRTRYNKVSLKLGHRFCGNDCAFLYGYVGGRWAQARVKWFNRGNDRTNGELREFVYNTEFDGGGFEVGLGFYQDVWCGFGISGRVGALGLWGGRKYFTSELNQAATQPTLSFETLDRSTCVGGYEMRLGINYLYECGCWWVRGEIGYEHNHYFNAIWHPQKNNISSWNSSVTHDFAIGGLYFGLSVGF